MAFAAVVSSDFDPFSSETRHDPYGRYDELRAAGPVVRLTRYGIWAVPRFAETKAILEDPVNFSSAGGAGLANYFKQKPWRPPSIVLEADPPLHTRTRAVLARVLSPGVMRKLAEGFKAKAVALVEPLVKAGSCDGVRDISEVFPTSVFPDALGIEDDSRDNFLTYGAMVFAGFGPENDYFRALMTKAEAVLPWVAAKCQRDQLRPGSFGAQIYEAADAGEISAEEAALLVRSLLSAGLDTTISGIGIALYNLAKAPAQWAMLADNPQLARAAFDETLRFDSPAPFVFRTTPHETEIAGVPIARHEKILLLVASANRDNARWERADQLDITRRVSGHVGFGVGIHGCVGQMVARLEAESVLSALAERVARIEITGDIPFRESTGLRAVNSLPLRLVAK
ncbi:cytochrome P450 [Bradyrhizobium sp. SSBR45G]|uniref:cytochrome P450 n=1 Tax=unclassified Bradyrhizobium TaxID=2631580 RepID=UPI002342B3DD|nr:MULTISPECIES: cytochrome P450 [unclassified Bradyrhizobium]GLH80705.1 cytochrome P450 [Bradyrhizobium sp. SSBR45G]GLH88094.1 cytochrome P450 [Bradyrhizobium sp. SSBR45R]